MRRDAVIGAVLAGWLTVGTTDALAQSLTHVPSANPKAPGVMIDLGITSREVGVAAPSDGHKLKMILKDDSGVRTEVRSVQIDPGQRLVVKW